MISNAFKSVMERIYQIEMLEADWDGEGSKPFSKMIICAIIEYLNNHDEMPHDIYPFGNEITLEWQYKEPEKPNGGGIIRRVFFTDLNDTVCVEQMTSFSDKPSLFELLKVIGK